MSFSNIKLVRDVLPRIIIQKGNQINNLNNIPNDKNKIFYYTYLNYGNMNVSELKNNFDSLFPLFNSVKMPTKKTSTKSQ